MTSFGMPELDRQLEQVMEAATKLRDIQEQIAEIRGLGEGADGRVKVEADNAGRLANVEIDPRAMRLPSEDLAQAFLEAAQQASDDVTVRSQELMNELMPEGMPINPLLNSDTSSLPDDAAEVMNLVAKGTDPVQSIQAALAKLQSRVRP